MAAMELHRYVYHHQRTEIPVLSTTSGQCDRCMILDRNAYFEADIPVAETLSTSDTLDSDLFVSSTNDNKEPVMRCHFPVDYVCVHVMNGETQTFVVSSTRVHVDGLRRVSAFLNAACVSHPGLSSQNLVVCRDPTAEPKSYSSSFTLAGPLLPAILNGGITLVSPVGTDLYKLLYDLLTTMPSELVSLIMQYLKARKECDVACFGKAIVEKHGREAHFGNYYIPSANSCTVWPPENLGERDSKRMKQ